MDITNKGTADESALLTQERVQKLELLVHLLNNLRQSLVVCGADGIGKTTLLNELQKQDMEGWLFCMINGSSLVSFEQIQQQISVVLQQSAGGFDAHDLAAMLANAEKNNQKIIVVIANAGELVTGLINSLAHYAAANPTVRIIFELSDQQLQMRSGTDSSLNECHLIELPALNEKQSAVFLQSLLEKPGLFSTETVLTDAIVAQVYRETAGIPGKIIERLPYIGRSGTQSFSQWLWVVGVAALLAIALSYIDWGDEKGVEEAVINTLAKPKPISINPPVIEPVVEKRWSYSSSKISEVKEKPALIKNTEDIVPPIGSEPEKQAITSIESKVNKERLPPEIKQTDIQKKVDLKAEAVPVQQSVEPAVQEEKKVDANGLQVVQIDWPQPQIEKKAVDTAAKKQVGIKSDEAAVESKDARSKVEQNADDKKWLLKQPGKNYAVQLIVLSSYSSLMKTIKQYDSLSAHLHYIKLNKNGQTQYVLLYGSFASELWARKAIKMLPASLKGAWLRKISDLQNDAKKQN